MLRVLNVYYGCELNNFFLSVNNLWVHLSMDTSEPIFSKGLKIDDEKCVPYTCKCGVYFTCNFFFFL